MVIDKDKTCCIIGQDIAPSEGTPDLLKKIDRAIDRALRTAAGKGHDTFICGMSNHFEVLCCKSAKRLRNGRTEFRLIAAMPYKACGDFWDKVVQRAYARAGAYADAFVHTGERYHRQCYEIRNRFLVDHANLLICYWNGLSGAAADTVAYARSRGVPVMNVADFGTPVK